MVIHTIAVEPCASELKNFVDAVDYLNPFRNSIEGCLSFDILVTTTEENKVFIYEEWESIELFRKYIKSVSYKKILALMELSIKMPEIKTIECGLVHNFNWIETLLNNNQAITNKK